VMQSSTWFEFRILKVLWKLAARAISCCCVLYRSVAHVYVRTEQDQQLAAPEQLVQLCVQGMIACFVCVGWRAFFS